MIIKTISTESFRNPLINMGIREPEVKTEWYSRRVHNYVTLERRYNLITMYNRKRNHKNSSPETSQCGLHHQWIPLYGVHDVVRWGHWTGIVQDTKKVTVWHHNPFQNKMDELGHSSTPFTLRIHHSLFYWHIINFRHERESSFCFPSIKGILFFSTIS